MKVRIKSDRERVDITALNFVILLPDHALYIITQAWAVRWQRAFVPDSAHILSQLDSRALTSFKHTKAIW